MSRENADSFQYLQQEPILLIIDDLKQDGHQVFYEYICTLHEDSKVIITTRSPLPRFPGLRIIQVPLLGINEVSALIEWERQYAEIPPNLYLEGGNQEEIVDQIYQNTAGLPLAIIQGVLAPIREKHLNVKHVLTTLASADSTFVRSYLDIDLDSLTCAEKSIIIALSTNIEGTTRLSKEDIRSLTGFLPNDPDFESALFTLSKHSILVETYGQNDLEYTFLPFLKGFCLSKLDDFTKKEYFVSSAKRWATYLDNCGTNLTVITDHQIDTMANIILKNCYQTEHFKEYVLLARSLTNVLMALDYSSQFTTRQILEHICKDALSASKIIGNWGDSVAHATNLAWIYYEAADYAQCEYWLQISRELFESYSLRTEKGNLYLVEIERIEGLVLAKKNDLENAIRKLKEPYALCDEMHCSANMAFIGLDIGHMFLQQGHLDKAKQYFREALNIGQNTKNTTLFVRAVERLGDLKSLQKEYLKAVGLFELAFLIAQDAGHVTLFKTIGKKLDDQRRDTEKFNELQQGFRELKHVLLTLGASQEFINGCINELGFSEGQELLIEEKCTICDNSHQSKEYIQQRGVICPYCESYSHLDCIKRKRICGNCGSQLLW